MQPAKKTALRRMVAEGSKLSAIAPRTGLLLMDLSLNPIAYDRGAAAILKRRNWTGVQAEPQVFPPREVLEMVGNLKGQDHPPMKISFCLGNSEYSCTPYLMERPDSTMEAHAGVPPHPMLALYIEKIPSVTDAIAAVATKYNLTEREGEALSGLSMGLCSKKLAEKMHISPNTVKVFLRLIMIKMGVSTRGGIVAEILNNQHVSAIIATQH